MTSGSFSTIPLDRIWVSRPDRQRRELRDIPNLADSISRLGLIHPPVVTRDYELKAGERRLEACRLLGWNSIPVQFTDQVNPTELLLLELEENIKREDITWQENCLAIHKYHELRKAQDPRWNEVRTAEAVGEVFQSINEKLMVVREMNNGNKMIQEAQKLSTAKGIARRVVERRRSASLEQIAPVNTKVLVPILHKDFCEYVKVLQGTDLATGTGTSEDNKLIKFNFLHCDFPYGINQQDHNKQNSVPPDHQYEDTFNVYSDLCDALERAPVSESAHLMFWFSMEHYIWTYERLTNMGWKVNKFPLVWSKGSSGILPDPARGPRRVYETAFMASRGDRKIVRTVSNHFAYWSEERIHSSEKPAPMLQHFFQMFVDEYTVMLDPTCGGGSAVRTAEKLGAKFVLGLEKESTIYETAKENYNKEV